MIIFLKIIFYALSVEAAEKQSIKYGPIERYCETGCKSHNTICKLQPCHVRCGKWGVMASLSWYQKLLILQLHNQFRLNQTKIHHILDMRALSYSYELELGAQCWANTCSKSYDPCRATPNNLYVGQNIFVASAKKQLFDDAVLIAAVSVWKSNAYLIDEECAHSYNDSIRYREASQILWAKTNLIGCGKAASEDTVYVVCNYAPAGNQEGKEVYQTGHRDVYTLDGKPFIDRSFVAPFTIASANSNVIFKHLPLAIFQQIVYVFVV